MTNLDDFDRSLGDFLAAGPVAAPEAPVVAALAHARTTPRRPDPFARLRSDVMTRPRFGVLGLRPGLVLAAIALVVASIGVAVVGSRLSDPSIVPPGPSTVPAPTTSPAPSPVPSGPVTFSADVPMIVAAGGPLIVRVTDTTGELISARSLQTGDGMSVDPTSIRIEADPTDPNVLVVTWTGSPCETVGLVTVDEVSHLLSIGREACSGDAVGFDRILRLGFTDPVEAGEWSSTFVQDALPSGPAPSTTTGGPFQPLGSPAVTPIHVVLDDNPGGPTSVDVVDESGRLVSAIAGTQHAGNGLEAFDATNDDAVTVRLAWPGRPCDTVHRLTIDQTVTTLTLDAPNCFGDSIGVERFLILTFGGPVDANTLKMRFFSGRGGVNMPTWTVVAPDSGSGGYDLTVDDPGYHLDAIEGYLDPETPADVAGSNRIRLLATLDPATLKLVWLGPACTTAFNLSIDPGGDRWRLTSVACTSAQPDVLRMVDVTLRTPRSADTITLELVAPD